MDSYTIYEVANFIGVHHSTLRRWIKAGTLKAWKTPGGKIRINRDELERLQVTQPSAAVANG